MSSARAAFAVSSWPMRRKKRAAFLPCPRWWSDVAYGTQSGRGARWIAGEEILGERARAGASESSRSGAAAQCLSLRDPGACARHGGRKRCTARARRGAAARRLAARDQGSLLQRKCADHGGLSHLGGLQTAL